MGHKSCDFVSTDVKCYFVSKTWSVSIDYSTLSIYHFSIFLQNWSRTLVYLFSAYYFFVRIDINKLMSLRWYPNEFYQIQLVALSLQSKSFNGLRKAVRWGEKAENVISRCGSTERKKIFLPKIQRGGVVGIGGRTERKEEFFAKDTLSTNGWWALVLVQTEGKESIKWRLQSRLPTRFYVSQIPSTLSEIWRLFQLVNIVVFGNWPNIFF